MNIRTINNSRKNFFRLTLSDLTYHGSKHQFHAKILLPQFALRSVVDMAQILMNLFVSRHPMWPMQVGMAQAEREIAVLTQSKLGHLLLIEKKLLGKNVQDFKHKHGMIS